MKLLDETTEKIKELKTQGIAISAVKCSNGTESVELYIGSLETRDIFDPDKDSQKAIDEDKLLDFYHET